MSRTKTYARPMIGWWRRNPYFVRYMIREASAPMFYVYALWLLTGLIALSRGREAYGHWSTLAANPWVIGLNVIVLVFAVYHTWTWFGVLPKTMPDIDMPARAQSAAGLIAAVITCLALLGFAWVATR